MGAFVGEIEFTQTPNKDLNPVFVVVSRLVSDGQEGQSLGWSPWETKIKNM